MVDSQATLLALKSNSISDTLIHDCIKSLNVLTRNYKVELSWVRAHKGVAFNEYADELAKNATKEVVLGPEPMIPWSRKVFYNSIREKIRGTWKHRWKRKVIIKGKEAYRQVKELFPDLNPNASKILLSMDRLNLYRCLQLLSGHNVFNRHLALIEWKENPMCRHCLDTEETSWHVLMDCPKYMSVRLKCFGYEFLRKPSDIKFNRLCTFIKGIKELFDLDVTVPASQNQTVPDTQ